VDFTFSQPGAWEMYCPVANHEDLGMKGDITVTAASAAQSAAPAPSVAAVPAAVSPAAPRATGPASAAAPVAQPVQLPRTGEAGFGLSGLIALGGLIALAGRVIRRRPR
jgi:LPXTG-motif cell wall-anchored protein